MNLKSTLACLFLFCFTSPTHAQTPALDWAFGFGGSSSDYPLALDLDSSTSVYVTGYFRNTVDFDPSANTANISSNGNNDIFLAKYDSTGNYRWAIGIGGSSNDRGYDLKTDQDANVYVVGSFQGTVDFDPGANTANLTSNGSNDIFLAKYDSSGNYLWAIAMGGSNNDQGTSLSLNTNGTPYITGLFEGTVDFDPGAGTRNITSNGDQDIFIAKYNQNGAHLWSNGIGSTGDDGGYSIAVSSDDSIHVTGYFENTVDFNPGAGTANISSTGSKDIFFGKYDHNGDYVWAYALSGTDGSLGSDITVDASGNVLLSGSYFATIDMDPSSATANLTSNGNHDGYVAQYDAHGNYNWAITLGGNNLDRLNGLSTDGPGNAYVTGYYKGTVDFDPGSGTFNLTSGTNNDAYVAKYNPQGTLVWAASLGGSDFESGFDVKADTGNTVFATGNFGGIADFDPGAGTFNLTSNGGFDGYLTRLEEPNCTPTVGTDIQTACDSLKWIDGNTYTTSNNTATHTLLNANGCDSVVTLDLTVNYSTTGIDVQTACDSLVWIDGITYTASNNTATDTLINAAGCDSIITLDLTINYSSTGTDVQIACDSLVWIDGITYTASNNTATDTLINAAGCDSIVTLDLTINYSSTGTDVQTACDSYMWIDGNTYTASNNTATHTLVNAAGCDSVVTLDLTINNSSTGIDIQTACDSLVWIDGNTYTASNNTATHTLTNATGCDSVVTLNLTINHSSTGTDIQTACNSYMWIDGNTYTASNNTATYTLTNAAGCDSVVTLNLTINNSTKGTDIQTACNSYMWIDGNTYTTSNNTATYTLTNAVGCDSVVTLDLTINTSTTGTDVQTACNSYLWIDGNTYTTSNNTATYTLTNAAGCDSMVTLDLTINRVLDITTTVTGVTIQANNANATYVWLDCDDNFAIVPGATSQSFTPNSGGNYAVELTENTCKDTSACVPIVPIGILENSFAGQLTLHPNPTDGIFAIDFSTPQERIELIIRDVSGKLILHKTYEHIRALEYELTQPKGVYILEISDTKGQRSVMRLIKH